MVMSMSEHCQECGKEIISEDDLHECSCCGAVICSNCVYHYFQPLWPDCFLDNYFTCESCSEIYNIMERHECKICGMSLCPSCIHKCIQCGKEVCDLCVLRNGVCMNCAFKVKINENMPLSKLME